MVRHTSELEDVLLLSVYFRFHIFPYLRYFMYMCSVAYFKGCSFTGVGMEFKIKLVERECLKL